ncbi:hypothetical protein BHY_1376 (plasmid) [Borrelia nietonii YOR]|uniref:Uncharacterized protein n=2 Tax=Borrelia TaxID=138 RepID=W5SBK2_9SPIR|nr:MULTISPECIES: hypothetical protein [Borrelia]AHH04327.1 hypothetical protein BHY_1376 [Borrelia nietonii YOR]AHH14501.1 hypothetical protein BHW_0900017 [Borrelia hermsii MTW]
MFIDYRLSDVDEVHHMNIEIDIGNSKVDYLMIVICYIFRP